MNASITSKDQRCKQIQYERNEKILRYVNADVAHCRRVAVYNENDASILHEIVRSDDNLCEISFFSMIVQ
jgi:hypothetical protein